MRNHPAVGAVGAWPSCRIEIDPATQVDILSPLADMPTIRSSGRPMPNRRVQQAPLLRAVHASSTSLERLYQPAGLLGPSCPRCSIEFTHRRRTATGCHVCGFRWASCGGAPGGGGGGGGGWGKKTTPWRSRHTRSALRRIRRTAGVEGARSGAVRETDRHLCLPRRHEAPLDVTFSDEERSSRTSAWLSR